MVKFSAQQRGREENKQRLEGAYMQNEWLYIGVFLILAPVFPALALVIPRLIAPRKPNPIKNQTYECGIETVGATWVQFKVQYYIFALVFLIFDVETVFLFPWAVAFDQLPLFAVFEGILFILILVAGLVYAWRKGALEWV
jgi:NADH:ubiquinone oxidoreductase subunit 3 (subunit A)